jgi:ubiquinone/menaquinone biosynthesis C-methylase UbiE
LNGHQTIATVNSVQAALVPVNSHLDAWDRDYRSRGRLWGGGAKNLPELPEGSRVLELGCGDGKTLAAMQGRFWDVTAIDISPEALRLSRSAIGAEVNLLLADARRLPFKGESFDAVFAFHVTGHVLQAGREQIAREVGRVLRHGGRHFFREFGAKDMRAGRGEEVEPGTFRRGGGVITHYFTEEEVANLFRDLEVQSLQTIRWKMRIKGEDFWRSEVEAVFLKS